MPPGTLLPDANAIVSCANAAGTAARTRANVTARVKVFAVFLSVRSVNLSAIEGSTTQTRLIGVIANPSHYSATRFKVFTGLFVFNTFFGKPGAPFGRLLVLPMVVFLMPTKVRIGKTRTADSARPADSSGPACTHSKAHTVAEHPVMLVEDATAATEMPVRSALQSNDFVELAVASEAFLHGARSGSSRFCGRREPAGSRPRGVPPNSGYPGPSVTEPVAFSTASGPAAASDRGRHTMRSKD